MSLNKKASATVKANRHKMGQQRDGGIELVSPTDKPSERDESKWQATFTPLDCNKRRWEYLKSSGKTFVVLA